MKEKNKEQLEKELIENIENNGNRA